MLTDEYRYKVLKLLDENPSVSQREIAKELGVSLGKVNYCLKALVERGLVKVRSFKKSQNKKSHFYLLTSKGVKERRSVAMRLLNSKINESQELRKEIQVLRMEIKTTGTSTC